MQLVIMGTSIISLDKKNKTHSMGVEKLVYNDDETFEYRNLLGERMRIRLSGNIKC